MTQKEFIEKATSIYGDKFSYEKVNFTNLKTKVLIHCLKKDKFGIEHGYFWIEPSAFLNQRQSCPRCSNRFKYTPTEFLKAARLVHHNVYNYDLSNYKNGSSYINIICPKHGVFKQKARFHLMGEGCPECGRCNRKRISQDEFIKKAKEVHGDKYDYSKVNFSERNSRGQICIVCPKHGEFWQTPTQHLQGYGCNYCSKPVHDTKSFINKCHEKYGDFYDYSKVNYVNSFTKVCIICPKHGEFWITPSNFLNKNRCPKCSKESQIKKQSLTNDEFIKRSKEVHGDKYDYSKVNYVNNHTKVCIICPEHGEFWQTPSKHLKGEGCPKCKESSLERIVRLNLEKNQITYIQEYTPPFFKRKRYDFCIPNKKILIECQGEQHYYPVAFGDLDENKTKQRFQNIVKSDKEKRDQAIKNGYKILYFTKDKLKKYNEIVNIDDLIDIINNS